MRVWYNSYDNEIISDRAHDEYFDSLVEDYDSEDDFEAFLSESYSPIELLNFTNADRDEAQQRFKYWKFDRAEAHDVYEPYEVRLASDEVEE